MEREDLPRHAWGNYYLRIPAEVEHEGGVGLVYATFRHEDWPNASVECSAIARANLLGRYPRRASVVLSTQVHPPYPGTYWLERLRVKNCGGWHNVSPLQRLDFYLEEDPRLPAHERNVRRFVRGEEVSLQVEASSRYGVKAVTITASGGYGGESRGERVLLRGEGDGSENCRVLLKGRIRDSQRLGRYRAREMEVAPSKPSRPAGGRALSERLNPPLVFGVLKNPNPPPPPPPKEPEVPNWGFSGGGDSPGPAR